MIEKVCASNTVWFLAMVWTWEGVAHIFCCAVFDKVSRHIKGWKKDQLKQELKYNDMKVGGNMQQLRMRIANCVVSTVWLGVGSPASRYTLCTHAHSCSLLLRF